MSRPKGCIFSEEHRAKLSEAAKRRYEDKEQRELASELTKKQWSKYSDEERKELVKEFGFTNKGNSLTDEHKAKISKANKGRKCSDEAKKRISKANKNRKHTKEARLNMSKAAIKRFERGGEAEAASKRMKEVWKNLDKDTRAKWVKDFIKAPSKHKGLTTIELKVKEFLDLYGINYIMQLHKYDKIQGRGFVFDFYLPEYSLIIECNGWHHTLPEKIKRDKQLEIFVKRVKKDVLWLWYSEVMKSDFDLKDYLEVQNDKKNRKIL